MVLFLVGGNPSGLLFGGTVPEVFIGEDGRLGYSTDSRGNRVPDFSNAGYLGGGVPIPEVPVRRTVSPGEGGDWQRIQRAIDEVGALPLDRTGFRGAVLLKAGRYEVGKSLVINKSGIVLRGEGDGEDGTVLNATGKSQYPLIDIGGTGRWNEVGGTRSGIIDDYVPVGARSFRVREPERFQVGDAIIVHRPSTAAWISALGMDRIPPRADGLPVVQWTAGSRDLHFDRIITAIDGNRITVDAPLVNAIEREFGGGSIYRYSFPGRISQVGVEGIRGVSGYDGGEWTPDQFDEKHAWSFIQIDRLQNGWVRDTTAVHFGFGNTLINSRAKWVTVQDSRNLFPVSTISGSRRYPFYIQGQLSLVQRCYANYSRHDFGTSSLTIGPNVFLDSEAEHSYSDTGPHHRWAVGILYDNIRVPSADISIQNRLNYGSGHGWAGANHVVWNSVARRIVVQNPPTAQNWAFGVIGNKWAGAFPAYAEDGYWISHQVPVEPQSLYLKQLEDRLSPEGTGGAISVVSFQSEEVHELAPGRLVRIPVSRFGNRDARIEVPLLLEGGGVEQVDFPPSLFIDAFAETSYVHLSLASAGYLGDRAELRLRLLHGPGQSIGATGSAVLVLPPGPFYSWRRMHFDEEELGDSGISGPFASAAGDGIANLLRYAFGRDPFEKTVLEDLVRMQREDGRMVLEFDLRKERKDFRFGVEVSGNLADWVLAEGEIEEIGSGNGGLSRMRFIESGEGESRRFFRVRIEPLFPVAD